MGRDKILNSNIKIIIQNENGLKVVNPRSNEIIVKHQTLRETSLWWYVLVRHGLGDLVYRFGRFDPRGRV